MKVCPRRFKRIAEATAVAKKAEGLKIRKKKVWKEVYLQPE
jgi:hypothetical protein